MGVAAAIVGGSVIGGLFGSSSASKAAKAQTQAANTATASQERMFQKQIELMQPYMQAGQGALPYLQQYLNQPADQFSFDYSGYFNSPEYAALSKQAGEQSLRYGAATGGLRGGDTQAALATIAPQLAQQARENAMSQFQLNQGANLNKFNQLMGIAGIGTGSASQVANAAQTFGQQSASNALYAGNARANMYTNQGNIMNNALGGIGQYYIGQALGLWGGGAK